VRWAGSAVLGATGTVVLVAVVMWLPKHVRTVGWLYVMSVGALALRLLARVALVPPPEGPLPFDDAIRHRPAPALPPADDRELDAIVRGSTRTAGELHYRLRRRLRDVAAARLATGHGVSPDEDPRAARRLLGPEAWELLRPDREQPDDRHGPGISIDELERIVSALEGI
jgi:hypothetical protein